MNNLRTENSQHEIAAFLQALNSYSECFEKNPLLSFEQHMGRVANETVTMSGVCR
ncbi:MAG TPA: hypothetical protein VGF44_16070 [Terriglobales bacterium]|jgi:hypothetical protein